MNYYSPNMFGDSNVRSSMEGEVVKYYRGRDLYHGDRLDLATRGFVEMDHILEKQCFSYTFHFIPSRGYGEGVDYLAELVKEEVANELDNLCFTRAATNRIKGAAVWKFLDDSLTGHVGYQGNATFNDYLLAENRDNMRLGRATTRKISGEMGTALKFCQRKSAAEGETPIIEALSDQLQRLYVKMQLHTSRSATSAARTKSRPSNAKTVGANDANANNKSDSSETENPTVANTAHSEVDPKVAVSTSIETDEKIKVLNASAKPFVPNAAQGSGSLRDKSNLSRENADNTSRLAPTSVKPKAA
ncbi:hypothetical protein L917_14594 [Phytophthora nicotianae]|uniref:Uncharacterized protein n=1 Tax=Phytophthora nicotianae TaxID=4792 RepID=W2KLJ0_PHYNI|nr:hypothetical protein L917_14594 [Phytophthora nicotianae]